MGPTASTRPRGAGRAAATASLLLTAALSTLVGCGSTTEGREAADRTEQAIEGDAILLGINPAPPQGTAFGGWPDPGSPNALSMARIWDLDVTWAQIEPSPPVDGVHTYVWDRLDDLVSRIIAADMRPLMVLYGTPDWAAPGCVKNYTEACPDYPADPENWTAFARAVAARYRNQRTSRGEAMAFEIWNEPNLGPTAPIAYWKGNDDQLFDLHRRAWNAVKAEAQATVVCCGWNRRAANLDTSAVDQWLARGGGALVDAVSYHPYPKDWDPSTASDITGLFRAAMARHAVARPLWATEVGLLNALGKDPRALTHAQQADLVSRTILRLRADAVPVVLWYAWDESHVGYADSNLVGLHRVVTEAVAAAGSQATAPPAATCDPATQPAPLWGVKDGQCAAGCGVLGGTSAFITPCVKHGMVDAGVAYDVAYCCKAPPGGGCDPASQPAPQWGEKSGVCLASCDAVGGTSAFTTPCQEHGLLDAGPAYDVDFCCWEGTPPAPSCDPSSQPAPQWGDKNGQCLPACGVAGGTSAFSTPCAQNGKIDAGAAYDVAYCCKDQASTCDPATQPAPQWGVKNGQCLPACGVAGGTSAFTSPCAQNGKVDAGAAYDVAYCCKDPPPVCDPASQPAPQWGVKNGQCLQACGLIGGTAAFTTPCSQHGMTDAGPAYDVAYCCR